MKYENKSNQRLVKTKQQWDELIAYAKEHSLFVKGEEEWDARKSIPGLTYLEKQDNGTQVLHTHCFKGNKRGRLIHFFYNEADAKKAEAEIKKKEAAVEEVKRIVEQVKRDGGITNPKTTQVIEDCRNALYKVLSEYIYDPEVDFDKVIAGITYWYELQSLAKSFGKKLLYFTPRKKKEDK